MADQDSPIVETCKQAWSEEFLPGLNNSKNCSGFVKSVASKLSVPLSATANADGILDEISSKWTKLASGKEAAQQAKLGRFTVAGLRAKDHKPARSHGHVVVVVDGPLYHGTYPIVWGGSMGSAQSQGTKSVGETWNNADRDNVEYYAYAPVCQ